MHKLGGTCFENSDDSSFGADQRLHHFTQIGSILNGTCKEPNKLPRQLSFSRVSVALANTLRRPRLGDRRNSANLRLIYLRPYLSSIYLLFLDFSCERKLPTPSLHRNGLLMVPGSVFDHIYPLGKSTNPTDQEWPQACAV
jgi:hypothetical protein